MPIAWPCQKETHHPSASKSFVQTPASLAQARHIVVGVCRRVLFKQQGQRMWRVVVVGEEGAIDIRIIVAYLGYRRY